MLEVFKKFYKLLILIFGLIVICCLFYSSQTKDASLISYNNLGYLAQYPSNRYLEIDQIKLSIPRSYLLGSSGIGENILEEEGLIVGFSYPKIEGGFGDGQNFIKLFIKPVKPNLTKNNISQKEYIKNEYLSSLLLTHPYKEKYSFKFIKYDSKLEKNHYLFRKEVKHLFKVSSSYKYKNVFVKGDIQSPDIFLVCDGSDSSRPYCKSGLFYKGLFVTAFFPKKYVSKYKNIEKTFFNLLNKWEIK